MSCVGMSTCAPAVGTACACTITGAVDWGGGGALAGAGGPGGVSAVVRSGVSAPLLREPALKNLDSVICRDTSNCYMYFHAILLNACHIVICTDDTRPEYHQAWFATALNLHANLRTTTQKYPDLA